MWQADSAEVQSTEPSQVKHIGTHTLQPYQVLRMLPRDATPEQQDSAIQANFKPKEIRFSSMPDTLHLPGGSPGKVLTDVSLPQYYKESFFAKDSLYHPELRGGRLGVAGDPMPYTVSGDNIVTSAIVISFVLGLIALSRTRHYLVHQAKNFFYRSHREDADFSETSGEVRSQLYLLFNTCFMVGILYFFYNDNYMHETITLSSPYQLLAIYTGFIAVYYLIKFIFYGIVNWTFYDSKKNRQWLDSYMFLAIAEGVLVFPVVLLRVYFNLSIENTVTYFLVVIIISKILLFYKTYSIFSRHFGDLLHLILYFCTLEMMPLFVLWSVLVSADNYLKINY